MDRDEYLRRACVLEARAAEFAYPGLRTALLNIAAQYRSLAKQVVAPGPAPDANPCSPWPFRIGPLGMRAALNESPRLPWRERPSALARPRRREPMRAYARSEKFPSLTSLPAASAGPRLRR
jgi:hypothetical protein